MKAKRLANLCILLILNIALLSQQEFLIDTDNMFYFQNVRIDNEGNFVSVFQQDSCDYNYTGGIIKFNRDFDYQTYLHQIDTAYIEFRDFIVTDENNYLIAGTIGTKSGLGISNHILYFLLLDSKMNVLTETLFPLPEIYLNPYLKILKNCDGRIYVTVDRIGGSAMLKGIIELSSTAQILKEVMHYDTGSKIMNPFPSHGSGFYMLRDDPAPWAIGGITEVDTNLNFTNILLPMSINGVTYDMGPRGSCKWLDDTTYLLYTQGSYESDTKDLYLYKLNNNHEFLTPPFIIGRDTINDIALSYQGIDWTDPEYIFVAGNVWASMYHQTTYYVAIINEDFELLGAKSYGGNHNTFVNSILSTPDGGCVMVGGQRDYQAGNENDGDGYVVFFQPDDIITSANDTPNPNDSDYHIYPNPGKNTMYIQTSCKGATLNIYDLSGLSVFSCKLSSETRNQISVSYLNSGFYVCQFIDENGHKEQKKWIKK